MSQDEVNKDILMLDVEAEVRQRGKGWPYK